MSDKITHGICIPREGTKWASYAGSTTAPHPYQKYWYTKEWCFCVDFSSDSFWLSQKEFEQNFIIVYEE